MPLTLSGINIHDQGFILAIYDACADCTIYAYFLESFPNWNCFAIWISRKFGKGKIVMHRIKIVSLEACLHHIHDLGVH